MKQNRLLLIGIIMTILAFFGCTTDQKSNGGNNTNKITNLQDVIDSDDVKNGTIIDLSEYADIKNFDYNATITKSLTIKNGKNLNGTTLKVAADGVIVDGIKNVNITTKASMKISNSLLSSLSISEVSRGTSASRSLSDVEMNGRGSAFPPIVEVYNTEVEEDVSVGLVNAYLMVKEFTAKKNVILNAVNAQLTITDKQTNIKEIKSDKSCLVILESGISDTIPIPTVTGNGIIKQIDMKASGEVKLLALAPVSELTTVIKQGEAIDFSTMAVLGSYQADDGVTGFRAGDLTYDMTERFSKLEKDFTISIDGKIAYQAGQNVSTFQWSKLSVGTHNATLNKNYQNKDKDYTGYTFQIVVIAANESQTDEMPTFELTEIEVKSASAKTEYTQGEPLNLSGLLVLGTYKENDGDVTYKNVISDYTLNPPNGTLLTTENKSVTVKVGNSAKTVTITVNPIQEEPETNPVIYTFKVNGGKWIDDTTTDKTLSGKRGDALTAPIPTRIGYQFNNWDVTVPTVFRDENQTFTAQWKALTFTVTLHNDGDVSGDTTIDVTYGEKLPKLTDLPLKTGYKFDGYYAAQNGNGTQYIDASGDGCHVWDLTSDATLYAYFIDKDAHHIYYQNTKGANIAANQKTFMESQSVTLPTDITAVGYTFISWYDSSADTASQVTGWAAGDRTGDVTLWAKWNAITYTVSFDANLPDGSQGGGSSAMSAQTFTYDVSQDISPCTFSAPTGYEFDNWNTAADGSGTSYSDGQTIKNLTNKNETITLYAIWKPQTYTIIYKDMSGENFSGDHGLDYPTTHTYGTATLLDTPTKDGFVFDGYYTNSNFSGGRIETLGAYEYTGDITLYAEWSIEGAIYVAAWADETGDGTKSNPFASILDALEKIQELDDSNADYTIALSGDFDAMTISDSIDDYANSLTICGANGLDDNTHKPKDSIEGNEDENALTIETSVPVTLKDIWITKGSGETSHGVYVNDESIIYLAGTPVIDDLYVEYNNDGTIFLAENLGSGAFVTITPGNEDGYPSYDDYYNEIYITQYIYSINDVDIADNCQYFDVTSKDGSDEDFFIDEYGFINQNCTVTFVSTETNQNFPRDVLFGSNLDDLNIKPNEVSDYTFAGWFKSNDGGTTLTEKVSFVYETPLTLYAKWTQPISDLYVNTDSGNDENAGKEASPLKTVSAAVAKIKDFGTAINYTIHVDGLSTESVVLDNTLIARSITLEGASETGCILENETQNNPILYVTTNVPVTLKNITIRQGSAMYTDDYGRAIHIVGGNVTLSTGTVIDASSITSRQYGAVYVSGGTLSMESNSVIQNWQSYNGGGIYVVSDGTVDMKDTSSIIKCSGKYGGGIYLQKGKVYMSGHAVIGGEGNGCSATNYDGGGIYVYNGTVDMTDDAQISYCSGSGGNGGGGVYINAGTFTMYSGSISHNSYSSSSGDGGGVWINGGASFIMKGGSISNNSVSITGSNYACGGGVYVYGESSSGMGLFDMQGGTISGNTANSSTGVCGYGVCVDGNATFKMGGSAVVASDNDVYLSSGKVITIAGELTDNAPVATITPSSYNTDTTVLAIEGNSTTLDAQYSKFAVTPQQGGTAWQINSSGQLSEQ